MNKYPLNIREQEVINRVRQDWFSNYNTVRQIDNIDFSVYETEEPSLLSEPFPFLWAEAKKGNTTDMEENLVQLALTVGKHRLYSRMLQPALVAAFDAERITFLEYEHIMVLFSEPWVDWTVTPSDHDSDCFRRSHQFLREALSHRLTFNWLDDERELRQFIRTNFVHGQRRTKKIEINRTSFVSVYFRWCDMVRDSIAVDWNLLSQHGIYDRDFYLADLISANGKTLRSKLSVVLDTLKYKVRKEIDGMGFFSDVDFRDGGRAHELFWNNYKRPPKKEYQKYILERAELLVPDDRRAYEGAYYTPRIWVEKAHLTLSDIFGDNWQDDYVIWDCAAGTGNLLRGLTNYYNVYASTDQQDDVDRMKAAIDAHDIGLLPSHVFQMDFLTDDLQGPKVPQSLKDILSDEQARRTLIVLINPPWAEAADKKTVAGSGENKTSVSTQYPTYQRYLPEIGIAAREIYAQFFMKIKREMRGCILAAFSKSKELTAPNFSRFRSVFGSYLFEQKFFMPSFSFENVKGAFPASFLVWDTSIDETFVKTITPLYDKKGNYIGDKTIQAHDGVETINDWIIKTRSRGGTNIGFMYAAGCDFQHANYNYIVNSRRCVPCPRGTDITDKNFLDISVYFAVRHCIPDSWINDRDLFLHPNDEWWRDKEFISDCIVWTLFSTRISITDGDNHWIPFTETEVDSPERFQHHTVIELLRRPGVLSPEQWQNVNLFESVDQNGNGQWTPLDTMSIEAQAVWETGRSIWKYYLSSHESNVNGSFYDIAVKYQTLNRKGELSGHSDDPAYETLRRQIGLQKRILEQKIAEKVFNYRFLIR